MKNLLLAGFTAALFTEAGSAFAGPAEEVAGAAARSQRARNRNQNNSQGGTLMRQFNLATAGIAFARICRRGKYAVVKLRKLPDDPGKRADCDHAMRILFENGVLTYGPPNTVDEFFVVMLRDLYVGPASRVTNSGRFQQRG